MRHRKTGRKFNRTSSHRLALMRNLFLALLKEESIKTTLPKAKELRSFVERLVTLARSDTVANRRLVMARLGSGNKNSTVPMVVKLFKEIAPRYKNRPGGYCRVLKNGFRSGDKAPMAIIQFVESNESLENPANEAASLPPETTTAVEGN